MAVMFARVRMYRICRSWHTSQSLACPQILWWPHARSRPGLGATGVQVVAVSGRFRRNRFMNGSVAPDYARMRRCRRTDASYNGIAPIAARDPPAAPIAPPALLLPDCLDRCMGLPAVCMARFYHRYRGRLVPASKLHPKYDLFNGLPTDSSNGRPLDNRARVPKPARPSPRRGGGSA
jgi:hypothetical protein